MSSEAITRPPVRRLSATRRGYELFKDGVLAVAALLGLTAVGWLVFAQVTGGTLVVFRTGSMAPALPQGAAAISFPASASDLRIGDVVTVSNDPTRMPVTHRVVEIHEVAGEPDARELVLRGDDNELVDIRPYVVKDVMRVAHGLPWGGRLLEGLQRPPAMVAIIAGVGLLTLWACWPSPLERGANRTGGTHRGRR